jgi:hypothetical protein
MEGAGNLFPAIVAMDGILARDRNALPRLG